ncbi:hypothetical protein GT204_32605 [Streptomyces sp. SID4919]|uniref:hypothetical protein n=1 Tax=unclassified Streptomyces TaxID=2593676 RepID=UPI000823CE9A|nr:hypothetical protein [Streptomyces sp. SID4919]SCK63116.1 hypothetical protein YW7DRAFT_06990 [Streptomyces sp. AmelKG-E11A]
MEPPVAVAGGGGCDGAPNPADLTQIVAAGDATDDDRTDFFATVGDDLWAFTGYHGVTIGQATRLATSGWGSERDLVSALDISGDGVTDLLYRNNTTSKLMLRKGIAVADDEVDVDSLASAANSAGGSDTEYGSSGWSRTNIPLLMGTPDANGDSVPDIWTVHANGSVRFYPGSPTGLSGSGSEIISPRSYWQTRITIG